MAKPTASEIPIFSNQFMKEIGAIMAGRIVQDADRGKFQNNKKNLKYKSAEYKTRKKAGTAVEVTSADTQTNFVNMRLTGDTLKRIGAVATSKGFTITFENGEIVTGNAKRGYDLYGLSNDNMSFLAKNLENEIERKVRKYEADDLDIHLGK
tara:strand:+ start:247 stop:702 length:456 start_codon:yes stop_codon:yes gene_type:complete